KLAPRRRGGSVHDALVRDVVASQAAALLDETPAAFGIARHALISRRRLLRSGEQVIREMGRLFLAQPEGGHTRLGMRRCGIEKILNERVTRPLGLEVAERDGLAPV